MYTDCISNTFRPLNRPTLWQNVVSLCAETKSVSLVIQQPINNVESRSPIIWTTTFLFLKLEKGHG